MDIKKNELLLSIDNFIKEKKLGVLEENQPNTLKKKELETFLETFAGNQAIPFQKTSEPTKTIYTFSLEEQEADIELFYRYSNYYTRHTITLK